MVEVRPLSPVIAEPEPAWYEVERHFHSTWRLLGAMVVFGLILFAGAVVVANGLLPLGSPLVWWLVGAAVFAFLLAVFAAWMVIKDRAQLLAMGRQPKL